MVGWGLIHGFSEGFGEDEEVSKVDGSAAVQIEVRFCLAEDPDEGDLEPDWTQAKLVTRRAKQQISIRLDADVLEWFKQQGKGYQQKIQAVLRAYKNAHEKAKDSNE